jgi:hypothetical protein
MSYHTEFRKGFDGICLTKIKTEFGIAMKYHERFRKKEKLTAEEWKYFAYIVERMEMLSASNQTMSLEHYRKSNNIFPYLRLRNRKNGFVFKKEERFQLPIRSE